MFRKSQIQRKILGLTGGGSGYPSIWLAAVVLLGLVVWPVTFRVEPARAADSAGMPPTSQTQTAAHADDAGAKWRALAELVLPGMDAGQMRQALPAVGVRVIAWNGGSWYTRYMVDDGYEVEASGIGVKEPARAGDVEEGEMVLTSPPRVKAVKAAGTQAATRPGETR